MNAQATVATAPAAEPHGAPQLRTILLTDLVDSTALVERLGDGAAAELFRAHDRLVLRLQNEWRGRLIDRSDGLLLLFERPVDGLGFALDYARGLRELGAPHDTDIKARAGLHVGEVLSWRNSDEAVRLGAKPVEVEGLAKPMAGRLMAMARPGQLLMSAVAEPLAHRAARELGERGHSLLWKSHGRWRFKGVPEAQQIFEVGEPGITPLRAPQPSPKAWRDIPLWRRPAALAVELALVAAVGLSIWFATRPQPAIAFNQRDWVVLADLRNLTDQPLLDDSLEQAFRISLEQSRHVNVLSDLKTRDTLARMQREPDTELDRAIASEIAIRDGARAVILPTVAEVGGRVRVSAEVIDPNSQTTVYAEYADGKGAVSALESIDEVTAALREKLGEAIEAIEETSQPLPQVATQNLEALRAYALGQRAFASHAYDEALGLYEQAVRLDPEFALAWIGKARSHYGLLDMESTVAPLHRAQELRSRLVPREAMYLDGWSAEIEAPLQAMDSWLLMTKLYPDFGPAHANVAIHLLRENRFVEAGIYAKRAAVSQYDLYPSALDLVGRSMLGAGDYAAAAAAFSEAVALGNVESAYKLANVAAARGQHADATKILADSGAPEADMQAQRIVHFIDRGEWSELIGIAESAEANSSSSGNYRLAVQLRVAVAEWLSGNKTSARARVETTAKDALAAFAAAPKAEAVEVAEVALTSGLLLQRWGQGGLADQMLKALEGNEVMELPELKEMAVILKARGNLLQGDADAALAELHQLPRGNRRYQTHVALLDAYEAAGLYAEALKETQWLLQRRGVAYAELGCYQCQQPLNVADSRAATLRKAVLLKKLGRNSESARSLRDFDEAWQPDQLPVSLRGLRANLLAASK